MKKVILIVDTFGWAFHSIAKQVQKHLGDQFDIEIIDRADAAKRECDVALWFWWKTFQWGKDWIRAKRHAIGMYDHWSIPLLPQRFAEVAAAADVFFCGNETIAEDMEFRAPGKQIVLTEDGVDTNLFRPQPMPETFTVGWAGNRTYKKLGLGDLKGVDMIEEACRLADVPLVIQDKQTCQIPQAEMPERFYRRISCYCCASLCEGTPNPVLEALACGRRVVSTRVGIVPKVVQCGVNGVIAERSAEALADGIRKMRDSQPTNGESSTIIEAWDWSKKAQAFREVFEHTEHTK